MKTKTVVVFDWALLIALGLSIVLTMKVLPVVWAVLEYILGEGIVGVPAAYIGSILFLILFYTVFIKRQTNWLSYLWFIIVTVVVIIAYHNIPEPFDKMHLFEYFIVTFLFSKVLMHYLFDIRIYIFNIIFIIILSIMDEITQAYMGRCFSIADMGADLCAAILADITIALVIRPKLEIWRFRLKDKRIQLLMEKEWLSKHSKP